MKASFLKTQCPMHARKVGIIIYSMAHRKRERKMLEELSGGLETRSRGISSHPSFALVSFSFLLLSLCLSPYPGVQVSTPPPATRIIGHRGRKERRKKLMWSAS